MLTAVNVPTSAQGGVGLVVVCALIAVFIAVWDGPFLRWKQRRRAKRDEY